ncbi:TIGR04219 family outer membrane beta-barrel protein [Thalassotalea piscium]
MKIKAFAAILAALFTAHVQADTVGLYIGGQIWQSEVSDALDEQDTLNGFNLKKEQQSQYFVAIEHPYPLLPNVRISSSTLDSSGKSNSTEEINFTDPASQILHTSVIDTIVDANVNVSYVDYTLYYELFDNGLFSFDLGLTARDFNGAITVIEKTTTFNTWSDIFGTPYSYTSNDDSTAKIETNDIEPMLYLASSFSLPLSNLSAFVQGDFLLKGDQSIYDYQVGLSYDLVDNKMIDFNLILGYRVEHMTFEETDNLYTEVEYKGAFAGVIAHF